MILDRAEPLDYDSLVVACGAETSYFGHDEWADASFGLKTLRDAVALRERIVSAFEEAERASDATLQAELMTFVVVGGGPTGVEIAGQLAILARDDAEAPVLADRHHDGSRDPHRCGRSGRARPSARSSRRRPRATWPSWE